MINFQELEKVAEFKNGELNWLEGRDINAVYVILVGDEYYIGSSHYTYLRIGQHLYHLKSGNHHSWKLQSKFDKTKEFEVYILERGITRNKLQSAEFEYIQRFNPSLNIVKGYASDDHEVGNSVTQKKVDNLVYKYDGGLPITDSIKVSELFAVSHEDVLLKIKHLLKTLSELYEVTSGQMDFVCYMYQADFINDRRSEDSIFYRIDKIGFTLLSAYYPEEKLLLQKLECIRMFNIAENEVRGELTSSINSLSRKQLAQMILDAENRKEDLRYKLQEKAEELYELELIVEELRGNDFPKTSA